MEVDSTGVNTSEMLAEEHQDGLLSWARELGEGDHHSLPTPLESPRSRDFGMPLFWDIFGGFEFRSHGLEECRLSADAAAGLATTKPMDTDLPVQPDVPGALQSLEPPAMTSVEEPSISAHGDRKRKRKERVPDEMQTVFRAGPAVRKSRVVTTRCKEACLGCWIQKRKVRRRWYYLML
ncbi:hypothetical protein ABW19_dt0206218 [Dactylella cylindrospora]|nr:hypothetical protein ABW19_dt0206218 [Dactylella cylindrospora]